MDHLIKRNGRHSTDILLYAMKAGDPVWPFTFSTPVLPTDRHFVSTLQNICSASSEKAIILLTLKADQPTHLDGLKADVRSALVDRNIGGISLPEHVSVWVFAEESDFPELFSDPAIASAAPTLERGEQAKNRQLGDPVNYVPSWKREDGAGTLVV